MLVSITACGSVSDGDDTNAATDNDATETEPVLPAGIERADYQKEFHIYTSDDMVMYQRYTFAKDEERSDAMSKALYDRELMVEEYLGVDITHELTDVFGAIRRNVQAMVMSGENTYQLVLTHPIGGVQAMVTEDILYDFNDFTYVDLSKDWWNIEANDNLEIGGKQYFAVSDYLIPDPNCILVNLDLLEQYKLDNPYDIVREGKWTVDKMIEMMQHVTLDNGDNVWDIKDQYGLGTPNDWYLNSFIYSSGLMLMGKNSDGEFELKFGDERTYTMMEKMDELINNPSTFVYHWNNNNFDETTLDISTGRVLFNIATVRRLYTLRDTNVNYGILPYPKLDESQDTYTNNDWSGLMCVPKTVEDPDMVGQVISLLSYYSDTTTRPAYFDVMLGEKLSRDEDSREMLDIIFDNVVYDAGFNYFGFTANMQKLFYTVAFHIADEKQNNFSSWFAKYQPGALAEIADFNQVISEME